MLVKNPLYTCETHGDTDVYFTITLPKIEHTFCGNCLLEKLLELGLKPLKEKNENTIKTA